mmetsp:Transcript_44685/g.104706  ORF Transcript_44685/g.104706 Transcript_44685/m.104706 type:complete len:281 (+) Transcript_44685:498-1340(+)
MARIRGEALVVIAAFNCPLPEEEWDRLLLSALAPAYNLFATAAVGGIRLCGLVSAEHATQAHSIETAARGLPAHGVDAASSEASRRGLACIALNLDLSSFCFVASQLRPVGSPAGLGERAVRELLEGMPLGEERASWLCQYHHLLFLGDPGLPLVSPPSLSVSASTSASLGLLANVDGGSGTVAAAATSLAGFRQIPMEQAQFEENGGGGGGNGSGSSGGGGGGSNGGGGEGTEPGVAAPSVHSLQLKSAPNARALLLRRTGASGGVGGSGEGEFLCRNG